MLRRLHYALVAFALLVSAAVSLGLTPAQRVVLFSGCPSAVKIANAPCPTVAILPSQNQGWVAGQGYVPLSSLLSITRASNETVTWNDGHLSYVSAGQLALSDLGLAVWEGRTNLGLYSQGAFNNATYWSMQDTSISDNSTTAPDNTTTASTFTDNSTNAGHALYQTGGTYSAIAYTASVFVKAGTGRYISLRGDQASGSLRPWITFDTQTNTIAANSAVTSYGSAAYINGWYRIWLTWTNVAETGTFLIASSNVSSAPSTSTIFGNAYSGSGSTWQIWGAQVEAGSFPSWYKPTTTVAVAGAADNITAAGALLAALEGANGSAVFKSSGTLNTSVNARLVQYAGGYFYSTGNTSGASTTSMLLRDGQSGNADDITATLGSGANTGLFRAAFGWGGGTASNVANAGAVATGTNNRADATGTITIGDNGTGTRELDGNFQRLVIFNSKLPNTTLQSLTGGSW